MHIQTKRSKADSFKMERNHHSSFDIKPVVSTEKNNQFFLLPNHAYRSQDGINQCQTLVCKQKTSSSGKEKKRLVQNHENQQINWKAIDDPQELGQILPDLAAEPLQSRPSDLSLEIPPRPREINTNKHRNRRKHGARGRLLTRVVGSDAGLSSLTPGVWTQWTRLLRPRHVFKDAMGSVIGSQPSDWIPLGHGATHLT